MFRKELIPILLDRSMTVTEIARLVQQTGKDTAEDLEHLLKSLKHTEYTATIIPGRCRKCGFEFGPEKLRKPSKCPECKETWVSEPRIRIERKEAGGSAED